MRIQVKAERMISRKTNTAHRNRGGGVISCSAATVSRRPERKLLIPRIILMSKRGHPLAQNRKSEWSTELESARRAIGSICGRLTISILDVAQKWCKSVGKLDNQNEGRRGTEKLISGTTCQAVEFLTEMFEPSLWRCYPMGVGPRWVMSNVLLMPAFKADNPVQILI
jgi:hypothetical protein